MKKYLPSKKFFYILGSFLIVALIFFIVFNLFSGKSSFMAKKEGKLTVDRLALAGLTVNDLVKKDSDSDGIQDWEETLWGTDKNNAMSFKGIPDKDYIENKKSELNINPTKDDTGLTETEKFAREFFTAYVAMKTAGTVDQNIINNFSSALGQKIVSPALINQFSIKDIKTDKDNSLKAKIKYYQEIKTLFENYKKSGIGSELDIISNQIASRSKNEGKDELSSIAKAYKDFASGIINTVVPSSLSEEHVKIANSANNTSISVFNMTKITNDPIVGLSGLSQYKKYSDDLISAVGDLEAKIR